MTVFLELSVSCSCAVFDESGNFLLYPTMMGVKGGWQCWPGLLLQFSTNLIPHALPLSLPPAFLFCPFLFSCWLFLSQWSIFSPTPVQLFWERLVGCGKNWHDKLGKGFISVVFSQEENIRMLQLALYHGRVGKKKALTIVSWNVLCVSVQISWHSFSPLIQAFGLC